MLPGKTYTPEDFVKIALRRKWAILLPFVVIAVTTVVVAHYLPNKYRSETVVEPGPVIPTLAALIPARVDLIRPQKVLRVERCSR